MNHPPSPMFAKHRPHRVVITGIGAVTALGDTFQKTWTSLKERKITAKPIAHFNAEPFPTKFAFQVSQDFESERLAYEAALNERVGRAGAFMLRAAEEALHAAGINEKTWRQNADLCLGNGMGTPPYSWFSEGDWRGSRSAEGRAMFKAQQPSVISRQVAKAVDLGGSVQTMHSACSSSAHAIGYAYQMVRAGLSQLHLAGGSDAMIEPLQLATFSLLGALSRRNDEPAAACRPFDESRDGFVLGEGACALILESREHALARGAKILGEIIGYGETASAYRITDIEPDGEGPHRAIGDALMESNLSAEKLRRQIIYVNAHGTATQLNDKIEAQAIARHLPTALVSSTKSMTGHMIAAAGAIEAAFCVQALAEQILPPSLNCAHQDSECPVNLTPTATSRAQFDFALSSSLGFGGGNTALVFAREGALT